MTDISIFWFRRDLRLEDNTALNAALKNGENILPIFIFDDHILNELPADDPRVNFIYDRLAAIDQSLKSHQSSLHCLKGKVVDVWKTILKTYSIKSVYINKDYEPYARRRDAEVNNLLKSHNVTLASYKDQVIHEEDDILKKDGTPYTVFTPYKNKWLDVYKPQLPADAISFNNFYKQVYSFPRLDELGFIRSDIKVIDYNLSQIARYEESRDFPALDMTSYLSPHLRFGTVSIRVILSKLGTGDHIFRSELIWREFFMQILFHFPHVVQNNFKPKYDGIQWINNENDFEKWCTGQTGYPMVDAGMRQLNQTGYMHNRVRMITAGFLCKHLLIDWRLGEAYFAKNLLDYELSANNGNWQWAAGTGCDAAPYFRIFNPITQLKKFDKNLDYIKLWLPEWGTDDYPTPIVEHKFARLRALDTYKVGLNN